MKISNAAGSLGAFALSFVIYLIPLFHLEAGWLMLGETLGGLREISAASLTWIVAIFILQAAAFLAGLWLMARFNWMKMLILIAAAPFIIFGANAILLWWIPLYVLVERDVAPEVGVLESMCSIPGASVAQVNSGSSLSLVRAGEALLVTGNGGKRLLLKMPGCQQIALEGRFDGLTIDAVAPGGRVLHRQMSGTIVYLDPASNGFKRLSLPIDVAYWKPILTDDGRALAWLNRMVSEGSGGTTHIHIRDLVSGEERGVAISLEGSEQIELLGAGSGDGPFTLARFKNAVFKINGDGEIVLGPISPDGVYDARWGFAWLNNGWLSWDGYREDGRSRIVWETSYGRGERAIPRGQRIDSLSVSANGSLTAVAISSNLRIGDIQSAIFAFRTDTGEEVYRRRFPVQMRSTLAFLGEEYLAVTEMVDGQESVGVYRIPMSN